MIVGAGFSGIATAIRLKQEGIEDFVVLERAEDVGGTWTTTPTPDACGTVASVFAVLRAQSGLVAHLLAPGRDPRYLRRCAEEFGVRPHLRTNVEVHAATGSRTTGLWEIETSAGTFTATLLVSGMAPSPSP